MLSPKVEKRLLAAQKNEALYCPNSEVTAGLGEKSLVMLVGPVAVGKSFIMNRVVEIDSNFKRIPVFTTREARPDDEPGMFRTIPHTNEGLAPLLDKIEQKEVVQYTVHPTNGRLYGSELTDYPSTYNLLPTLTGAVAGLEKLPFKSTFIIGVVAPLSAWKQWLSKRYPTESEEKTKRLKEAVTSLRWLLDPSRQNTIAWIKNEPTNLNVARDVIHAIHYNQKGSDEARRCAAEMLAYAEQLLGETR